MPAWSWVLPGVWLQRWRTWSSPFARGLVPIRNSSRVRRYTDAHEILALGGTVDVLRILFSILIPPLGVFLQVGIGLQFWINLILTLLGYVPGLIHAIWIIMRR